jgi:hypothetical protein
MKAILLTILCALTLCLNAQHYLPKFEIGIQAGPGVSFMRGPGIKKQKDMGLEFHPALSFAAGVTLQGNLKKVLGFRTGVMVERRGFYIPLTSANSEGEPITLKYITQYHYINVPLLLQLHTGARTAFTVQMGGYVGGLFRSNVILKGSDAPMTNPGGYYYFDGGVTAGIGLRIPIKQILILTLEARENVGLTRVIRNTDKADRMYNNNVVVMLGIGFGTKRK